MAYTPFSDLKEIPIPQVVPLTSVDSKLLPSYPSHARGIEVSVMMANLLQALPEREHEVIRMRYYEDKTLVEISQELGVSTTRVQQIERRAFRRLSEKSTSRAVLRALHFYT